VKVEGMGCPEPGLKQNKFTILDQRQGMTTLRRQNYI